MSKDSGKDTGGQGGGSDSPHTHPGGGAAILGVQLLRFSGVQGASLGLSNLLQYASVVAVGAILGTSDLGRYSLLLFLTGLVTTLIHVATKPGTIQRTFGVSDDDGLVRVLVAEQIYRAVSLLAGHPYHRA